MSEYAFKTPGGGFLRKLGPLFVIAALFAIYLAYNQGWIKGRPTNKVETVKLDEMSGKYVKDTAYAVAKSPLPDGDELVGKPFAVIPIYDWHANTALVYANGGAVTLENSLVGKENLLVQLKHQDDTNISIKEFLASAAKFKESGGKSGGNLAFSIMGNASVPLIEPVDGELKKIDPSFRAVAFDLIGKSDGEDQLIGPKEWLGSPDAMRGKIVVGVYDDGDVQVAVMYADKVGVPVNFDYHTWNKNALNIENVDDFIKAGKVFVSSKELDPRPEVDDEGRRTGKTTSNLGVALHADAVASWTPVDRNIVRDLTPERLDTLATITSTGLGEQRKVMPCVLIGLNKWVDQNSDKLTKLSYATHAAAMQLDKYPDALAKAMELNTSLLGIWDDNGDQKAAAEQRLRAYKGYYAPQNKKLHVGGSAVFSFRDALNMVGEGDDLANSTYASVYRSFGNLTVRKYPEKHLKTYTSFEQFFDARVLRTAAARAKNEGLGFTELIAKRNYSEGAGAAIGSTSFQITFRTGSAEIEHSAYKVLQEIQDNYAATEYPIEIVGHTDRTGSDAVNQPLSEHRAAAVKEYLVARNSRDFGGERIATEGRGSAEPPRGVNPNYTGNCDACRRVEIVIHR